MDPSKALVVSSHLVGEEPFASERYQVLGVACEAEMSYWAGLAAAWDTDRTLVNVEHDMEFTDELVDGLLGCEHPLCMYPYRVFPTTLGRYIYCATTDAAGVAVQPRWVEGPYDEWALWASIGFCKITPDARSKPLDPMFWQWLEHSVNRVVTLNGVQWHLHWPEVAHHHDYEVIPDHLW